MTEHYSTEIFATRLKQCRLFRLKHPRGGQHNDGYELNAILKAENQQEFLHYLKQLELVFYRQEEAPKHLEESDFDSLSSYLKAVNNTGHIQLSESHSKQWLFYEKHNQCLGIPVHLSLTIKPFEIHLNRNGLSWYEVTLDDIQCALQLESKIRAKGLSRESND